MGRLNYRLIFSLLAAGSVLFTILIPATRPLTQRAFWMLSGTYQSRTQVNERDYTATQGLANDYRVALLLSASGHIPVEARVSELTGIALKAKSAAMWAHVARQASHMPIRPASAPELDPAAAMRRNTVAELELFAAKEGRKLDPTNSFFCLAEATALARMGRWDEIVPPMEAGAKLKRFDDYTNDVLHRQLRQMYKTVNPVLPSDIGNGWGMVLLPHLSGYTAISRGLGSIPSEGERLRATLALAQIGEIIHSTQEMHLMKVVGKAMVLRSFRHALGVRDSGEKAPNAAALVPQLEERATELGLTGISQGFSRFRQWKPLEPRPLSESESFPLDITPMLSTYALLILAWMASMGTALWLGRQVEPNFTNIMTGIGAMLAFTSLGFGLASLPWLSLGWAWGSLLVFAGFLVGRLPGKRLVAIMLGMAGATMIVAATASHGQYLGNMFLLLWAIPFGLAYGIRWAAPRWVCIGHVSILIACGALAFANGLPSTPQSFEKNLIETLSTMGLLSTFGLIWITACTMGLGKLNLSDSLGVALKPIPLFALVAAGFFLWGTQQQVRLQFVWTELLRSELPEGQRKVLEEVQREAREGL